VAFERIVMFRFPDGGSEIRYPSEQTYREGERFDHHGTCYDVARVASEGKFDIVTTEQASRAIARRTGGRGNA
jgi:hypothetical protein